MQTHAPPNHPKLWQVILVLTLGTFAMGNAKFSIIPLVPIIAADLNTSNQAILDSVFAYFWGAFIGAPILAVVFRNWSKPKILALLSLWCFLGNFLTSFAPNAEVLYWLRWFSSIPHAAFMAFATLLICEVAPAHKKGIYLGAILFGLSVSTLFVIPFNTIIGMQHGWEISFRFVALLDLLICLLVFDLLPKSENEMVRTTVARQLQALKNKQVWILSGLGLCVITCTTAAWSFGIASISHGSVLNIPLKMILMVSLGMGFMIGPLLGGWFADKNLHKALGINTVYTFVVLLFLFFTLFDYRLGILSVFLISISFSSINAMMQLRLLSFPISALYLIMCLFNACIQLGNFLGSLLANIAQQQAMPQPFMIMVTLPLSALAMALWYYTHRQLKHTNHVSSASI